jgi:uncharacterized SAM-binding protein YcdF (DUF218 family)
MPSYWLLLKQLSRNLILPPAGPLLLSLAGVLLIKRRPGLARVCLVVGVGSLWLLSTPVISDVFSRLAERYPALDPRDAVGAQAVVILGGGGQRALAPEYQGPAAEPFLLERLSYGAYVAQKTHLPILVTGYAIEAAAMRETLRRNFGVDPRWVDDGSFDTFQNAGNSVRMLNADGVRRIVLVTRATHMRRSVEEFRAAGIEVIPAPVGVLAVRDLGLYKYLPNTEALLRSDAAIYELLGEPVRRFFAVSHLRRH